MKFIIQITCFLMAILLVGCGSTSIEPEPTPTATPEHTHTATTEHTNKDNK